MKENCLPYTQLKLVQDVGHEHVVKIEPFDIAEALRKGILMQAQSVMYCVIY
jgi:hypothetical protein